MKKLLIGALATLIVLPTLAATGKFSITGQINGLAKGDTLEFKKITYPTYETVLAFRVITDARGAFKYKGQQAHNALYLMEYKPTAGAKMPELDRSGQKIFIADGDKITINGERNFWAVSTLGGGAYSHPTLAAISKIEDSLVKLRSSYLQQLCAATESQDSVNAKKYGDLFNDARVSNQTSKELWKAYMADSTASELAVVRILSRAQSMPEEQLEKSLNQLPQSLKNSHHGEILNFIHRKILSLRPGGMAPSFTLTDNNGAKVELSSFKGKYLLIYHWGACPGSIMIDPNVCALWRAVDKEQVAIIGVTSGRNIIKEVNAKATPQDSMFGVSLKDNTDGMLAHPFADYDLNLEGNNEVIQNFAIAGLPYFVLIDPKGKMVVRGFQDALYKAQDIVLKK